MKTIAIVFALCNVPALALAGPTDKLPTMPAITAGSCETDPALIQCRKDLGTVEGQRDACYVGYAECHHVTVEQAKAQLEHPVTVTVPPPAKPKKVIKPTQPTYHPAPVAVPAKNGRDGKDGQDGKDGVNGQDGKDGTAGLIGLDGHDGKDGRDGAAIFQLTGIGSSVSAFKVDGGYARALFVDAELSIRVAEIANLTLTGGWAPGKKQAAFGQFMLDVYPFAGARWLGFAIGGHAQWLDINSQNFSKYQYLAGSPAIVLRSTNDHGLKFRGEVAALIGVEGRRGDWHEANGLKAGLAIGF